MDWFLFSIVSVLALSVTYLLQRVMMRDQNSNPAAYSAAFSLICAFLIGVFAFVHGFEMPPVQDLWIQFVLIMVLFASGTLFHFAALKTIEISEVTVIISSRVLWTIAVALIFLGESFDLTNTIGAALVLGAIVLVSFKGGSFKFNKGVYYALGCGFCYGTAFAVSAYILQFSEVFSYTAISFLLPGLFILLVRPRAFKDMKRLWHKSLLPKMLLTGIFASTSATALNLAYQMGGGAAQLSAINQSVVVLTVILAAIFLGERGHFWQKFAGAVLATIGVILLK